MSTHGTVIFDDERPEAVLDATLGALQIVLEDEWRELLAEDADSLLAVTERKQALLSTIERHTAGLRGASESEVDDWLAATIADPRDRERIRERLAACAERNLANGRQLARLRTRNDALLTLLTGSPMEARGYGAAGNPERSHEQRSLARA